MGSLGFISGFLLIIFESMIPVLPLAVFIALNIMTFGSLFGFILSWVATVTGCMISFYLCRKLRNKFEKKIALMVWLLSLVLLVFFNPQSVSDSTED